MLLLLPAAAARCCCCPLMLLLLLLLLPLLLLLMSLLPLPLLLLPAARRAASPSRCCSSSCCGCCRTQRLQVFAAALLFGVALMMLAIFVFLPMILFVPSKFALSFTLGSLMFLFAFAILRGPKTFVTNLLSRERLVFSSAYFGSIGASRRPSCTGCAACSRLRVPAALTLFAALGLQSYLMVMISSGIQLTALTYHAVSYVPGGTSGLNSEWCWCAMVCFVLNCFACRCACLSPHLVAPPPPLLHAVFSKFMWGNIVRPMFSAATSCLVRRS